MRVTVYSSLAHYFNIIRALAISFQYFVLWSFLIESTNLNSAQSLRVVKL